MSDPAIKVIHILSHLLAAVIGVIITLFTQGIWQESVRHEVNRQLESKTGLLEQEENDDR